VSEIDNMSIDIPDGPVVPSVREMIMRHFETRFKSVRKGRNGYTTTWNTVTRKPVSKTEISMGDVVGLYDVGEVKTPDMQFTRSSLRVTVEFFCVMKIGDDPSTELNRQLLDVQRLMLSDIYCGGLTLNIVENRNELDIDGPADRVVAGVADFQVLYRHNVHDPRRT
jgi:hypothetical protein